MAAEKTVVPQIHINTQNSMLWTVENYCPSLFSQLQSLAYSEEPEIFVYGRVAHQHRDIIFFSDTSIGYKYSGQMMKSTRFDQAPFLLELLNAVNKSLGTNFNGILINRYKDGTKYISAHSDNEKALDQTKKMVASISFGATRTFRIRDKKTEEIVLDLPHNSGTLLVMQGDFQLHYTHEIPIQKKIGECRISVTFRQHTE